MRYAVIGAGAIGGTVAAGLIRDGHDVLLCDADAEHVAAINADGLRIEGPVEQLTVRAPAVTPDALPGDLGAVLLAVKAHHTEAAMATVAPLLAPGGFVVSLQNGFNEDVIAAAVGRERVVGAFVNFGADVIGPGRILRGNRAAFWIGELDGADTPRVRALAADIADARQTANIHGFLWSKEAYGAMLFATAVSDLSIADALAEPRFRPLYLALAREVLAAAPCVPEPFDGFDPADLEGSIDRLVEFNRGSAKTHSGIYRDLAVRHRKTEVDSMLGALDGTLTRRTAELIHAIEDGRRVCERANLELLAAYERLERLGRPLNAVITVIGAPERAADGPLHGEPIAIKDNIDVAGEVTTNASTVAVPPPAEADAAAVARLRAAAGDVFCKTNLLEYGAGSVNPAYGMTYNPLDPSRTAGGSSSGSAALVAAGVCDLAVGTDCGGSIRVPAAYCGIVGVKPTTGSVPSAGHFPLARTCDGVGPMARTVAGAARLLAVLQGRPCPLDPDARVRIGVVREQVDDPDVHPQVRARVTEALAALAALGFELIDVSIPELEVADAALGTIVLREAWDVHADRYRSEGEKYGEGTRALLDLASRITDPEYRDALADAERVAAAFARAFGQAGILVGPTMAYVAPPEDPPFGTPEGDVEARFTGPCNLTRIPAVTICCGLAEHGLPAALQLMAPADHEPLLLSVAAAYEKVAPR
ncbi:MAG TPA: amidase family protein [Gaiellales bacterium]